MMAGLAARGARLGEAAAERARARVAAALRDEVRGSVTIEGDEVVVSGRHLAPFDDPVLLWIGGLLR